jgi:hypothetical protein
MLSVICGDSSIEDAQGGWLGTLGRFCGTVVEALARGLLNSFVVAAPCGG